MVDRSAVETRYFPDVVERIVGPWRDAGPERPEGRVVIVSGTPHSGRASVLGQVAGDLRSAGVRVVRRAMRDGVLRTADDSGPGEHAVQGAKVLAASRCRTIAHAQPPTNRERRWPAGGARVQGGT